MKGGFPEPLRRTSAPGLCWGMGRFVNMWIGKGSIAAGRQRLLEKESGKTDVEVEAAVTLVRVRVNGDAVIHT